MKSRLYTFEEFLNEAISIINEAETTGNFGSLKEIIGGGLKMSGNEVKKKFDQLIDELNELGVSSKLSASAKKWAERLRDYYNSSEKGIKIAVPGKVVPMPGVFTFEYLVNGFVTAKGFPKMTGEGDNLDVAGLSSRASDGEIVPLTHVLLGIFVYNLHVLAYGVNEGDEDYIKNTANTGKKGKNKAQFPFLTLDKESLKTSMLQVIPLAEPHPMAVISDNAEYGFSVPVWTYDTDKYDKGVRPTGGKQIGSEYYEEVVLPTGNDVEVADKEYNSAGTAFFAENDVKMSPDGLALIKSILSQFNSIDKIVVSGGASSKPTSRSGGNQKLAEDRRATGMQALEELKKSGVIQLKNTSVEKGDAKVQAGDIKESDPKNQQVSFKITGKIKGSDSSVQPTIISGFEDIRADIAYLRCHFITFGVNVA